MRFGTFLVFLSIGAAQEPSPPVRIAARINDEIITWDEVDAQIRGIKVEIGGEDLQLQTLRKLAEERLFLQEARKAGITVNDSEVDRFVEQKKKEVGGEDKYEDYLAFIKRTRTQYWNEIKRQIVVQRLILFKYSEWWRKPGSNSPVLQEDVSPQEIREYYLTHREEFQAIEWATLLRITLSYAGEKEKQTKKRLMDSLQRKLAEGSEFLVLAAYYSELRTEQHWRMDKLERRNDYFSKAVTDMIFDDMRLGESRIVDDDQSLNLLRLEERESKREETFEEAQIKISNSLIHERREQNRLKLRTVLLKQAYLWPPDLF